MRRKEQRRGSKNELNKAVYTAPLVACWWAGAVKWQKKPKKQTDHGRTDIVTCRVA